MANAVRAAGEAVDGTPAARVALGHRERHLRRRLLRVEGEDVLVDLARSHRLAHGDRLVLADGREIEVEAAPEPLLALRATGPLAHAELCWHLGNRHVEAEIAPDRVLVARDPVLRPMMEALGVAVEEVEAPFQPVRGAYHDHSHD